MKSSVALSFTREILIQPSILSFLVDKRGGIYIYSITYFDISNILTMLTILTILTISTILTILDISDMLDILDIFDIFDILNMFDIIDICTSSHNCRSMIVKIDTRSHYLIIL